MKAVDPRNKKKEEEGRRRKKKEEEGRRRIRWRNGHILQSVKYHETCAVHLNN